MRWLACVLFWFVASFAYGDEPPAKPNPPTTPDPKGGNSITLSKEEYDKLMGNQKDPKDPPKPDPNADPLLDNVDRNKKSKDQEKAHERNLEAALKFNLSSDKFIKENESILPKDVAEIFAAASKEKYDSQIEQANATKAALIKKFFEQQVNVDVLTPAQRVAVEDYLKLTNAARQEKAAEIYVNVLEPVIEMLKRVKKAEEVGKARDGQLGEGSDSDKAYKAKLVSGSLEHYLGVKKNA